MKEGFIKPLSALIKSSGEALGQELDFGQTERNPYEHDPEHLLVYNLEGERVSSLDQRALAVYNLLMYAMLMAEKAEHAEQLIDKIKDGIASFPLKDKLFSWMKSKDLLCIGTALNVPITDIIYYAKDLRVKAYREHCDQRIKFTEPRGKEFKMLIQWVQAGLFPNSKDEAAIVRQIASLDISSLKFGSIPTQLPGGFLLGVLNGQIKTHTSLNKDLIANWLIATKQHGEAFAECLIAMAKRSLNVYEAIHDQIPTIPASFECNFDLSITQFNELESTFRQAIADSSNPQPDLTPITNYLQALGFEGIDGQACQLTFAKAFSHLNGDAFKALPHLKELYQALQAIKIDIPDTDSEGEDGTEPLAEIQSQLKAVEAINIPEGLPKEVAPLVKRLRELKNQKVREITQEIETLQAQSGAAVEAKLMQANKGLAAVNEEILATQAKVEEQRTQLFELVQHDGIADLKKAAPEEKADEIKAALTEKLAEQTALKVQKADIDESLRVLRHYVTAHLKKKIKYKVFQGADPAKQAKPGPWNNSDFETVKISGMREKVMQAPDSFADPRHLAALKTVPALENFDPNTQTIFIRRARKAYYTTTAEAKDNKAILKADFESLLTTLFTPKELAEGGVANEYYDCTRKVGDSANGWHTTRKVKLMQWNYAIMSRIPAKLAELIAEQERLQHEIDAIGDIEAKQRTTTALLDEIVPSTQQLSSLEESKDSLTQQVVELTAKLEALAEQQASAAKAASELAQLHKQAEADLVELSPEPSEAGDAASDEKLTGKPTSTSTTAQADEADEADNTQDKQTKPIFKWNWKAAFKVALVIGIILGVAAAGTFGGLMIFGAKTLVAEKILFGLSYLGKLIASQFANLPAAATIAMNAVIDLVLPVATALTLIAVPWSIATLCHEEAVNASSTSNFSGSGSYDAFSEEDPDAEASETGPAAAASDNPLSGVPGNGVRAASDGDTNSRFCSLS